MKQAYVLREYYVNYLRCVRRLSESSINHYIGGLSSISKLLIEKEKIQKTIYEVNNLPELFIIREYLKSDSDFLVKDSVGHNMYSAALNNYIRFAQGDDYFTEQYSFTDIDTPVKISEKQVMDNYKYKRAPIIKLQAIKAAHYTCECDNKHTTFTAKSNNVQYMEGHHLIPLKHQGKFEFSLDIYANIVSLCPICHRLLHYGIEKEKRDHLEKLYKNRYVRLYNSGIRISQRDFLELTM